jgi:deoxyribodipyrimidine photolyase-related protein
MPGPARLVLFPHQLFADYRKHLPKDVAAAVGSVVLWDDPVFYGDRRGSAHGPARLQLNPLRVAWMKRAVAAFLARNPEIAHVTPDEIAALPLRSRYAALADGAGELYAFDAADALLEARLKRAGARVTWLDSPMFLLGAAQIAAYSQRVAGNKRLQQAPFYRYVKEECAADVGPAAAMDSLDAENRAPFPKGAVAPVGPPGGGDGGESEGGAPPVDPDGARAWLRAWIAERFALFGKYEDAMVPESRWMYHSGVSVFLNVGLLTPREVLAAARAHYARIGAATGAAASYEGFVRQIAGWREYARFYYRHVPAETYAANVFGLAGARKRAGSAWYRGDTGLPTVDRAVREAFADGYLHHIRRLMVVGNAMTLSGAHPDAVFAWMYEFALDSWDWVMVFNVYAMGTWSDGGVGMRKPYVSGSGYLRRMTRGGLAGGAAEAAEWDRRYSAFLAAHVGVLEHTTLAGVARRAARRAGGEGGAA